MVEWYEIRQNVAHCASLTLLKGKFLTSKEEKQLVEWYEIRQNVAHCASLTLLKGKVKQICSDRITPFREGTPSRNWWH